MKRIRLQLGSNERVSNAGGVAASELWELAAGDTMEALRNFIVAVDDLNAALAAVATTGVPLRAIAAFVEKWAAAVPTYGKAPS